MNALSQAGLADGLGAHPEAIARLLRLEPADVTATLHSLFEPRLAAAQLSLALRNGRISPTSCGQEAPIPAKLASQLRLRLLAPLVAASPTQRRRETWPGYCGDSPTRLRVLLARLGEREIRRAAQWADIESLMERIGSLRASEAQYVRLLLRRERGGKSSSTSDDVEVRKSAGLATRHLERVFDEAPDTPETLIAVGLDRLALASTPAPSAESEWLPWLLPARESRWFRRGLELWRGDESVDRRRVRADLETFMVEAERDFQD